MKNQLANVLRVVALAGLVSGTLAWGQSIRDVETTIPFAFRVMDKEMPAGDYMILQASTPGVLRVRTTDGRQSAFVTAPVVRETGTYGDGRLQFHRYGNRYFLAEVQRGDGSVHALPQGRHEKELARAQTGEQVVLYVKR